MQQAEQSQQTADYEQAVEFVEALIAKKYPGDKVENHADERDRAVQALSDEIETALVDQLTEQQQRDLNTIAERGGDTSAAFLDFFIQSGINFNQIVRTTMLQFANNFLGGTNE